MDSIVLASNNPGKLREIRALLDGSPLTCQAQDELGVSSVEETGLTFIENALIKARHAAEQTGYAAIADDSGLCVDALSGAPGIYSARFAGQGATDEENLQKLLSSLAQVPAEDRTARFQCVIVYLRHEKDPAPVVCQGTWEGVITNTPRGENGFGYDPVFLVPELGQTAAELSSDIKNQHSHRGQAVRQLATELRVVAAGRYPNRGSSKQSSSGE